VVSARVLVAPGRLIGGSVVKMAALLASMRFQDFPSGSRASKMLVTPRGGRCHFPASTRLLPGASAATTAAGRMKRTKPIAKPCTDANLRSVCNTGHSLFGGRRGQTWKPDSRIILEDRALADLRQSVAACRAPGTSAARSFPIGGPRQ